MAPAAKYYFELKVNPIFYKIICWVLVMGGGVMGEGCDYGGALFITSTSILFYRQRGWFGAHLP